MTTHSELTRRHTPRHVRRRWRFWAPTAALGLAWYALLLPHPVALAGGLLAAASIAALICDQDDT